MLGLTQIFAWGSSYYLPTVLAQAIANQMNITLASATGGLSAGLLVAGLISPRVGSAINRTGGRSVLAASSALLGSGLICLGLARDMWSYTAAWLIMGIGMGAGLYDAAFATLGRIYGRDAREVISSLTLIAGFSSTICWPLSSYLLEHFGWRSTCFFYAAVQLLASLPIHWFTLPAHPVAATQHVPRSSASAVRLAPEERHIFLLLAAALTIAGVISAIVSIHILSMLQDLGMTPVAAVAIGALIGPSQVGARALEVLLGRRYQAIWTLVASATVSAVGLALLLFAPPVRALAVILYGAGTGIGWIARGTVPLALFGPENYPALLGRLALPSTVSMALAPFFGAVIIQRGGALLALLTLTALAIMNVALVAVLFQKSLRRL